MATIALILWQLIPTAPQALQMSHHTGSSAGAAGGYLSRNPTYKVAGWKGTVVSYAESCVG